MCFFMVGAILKVTNSSFQKGVTFGRSIYVKKVMKLLAFIFEQSSYIVNMFYQYIYTCMSPSIALAIPKGIAHVPLLP